MLESREKNKRFSRQPLIALQMHSSCPRLAVLMAFPTKCAPPLTLFPLSPMSTHFGWRLLEETYRLSFNYRPVFCWNCAKVVLVKNSCPRRAPECLPLPRARFYSRPCVEFL